jgi:adenylate kinase family enzyme
VAPARLSPDKSAEHGYLPGAYISVLGPPAVGKSTLVSGLVRRTGWPLFKIRDFFYGHLATEPRLQLMAQRTDSLGWFSDDLVQEILASAFPAGLIKNGTPIIVESFPGSKCQVRQLMAVVGNPELVIVMSAPNHVLRRRAAERVVCSNCDHDPQSQAHRPAAPSPHHPGHCAGCDGPLSHRADDDPASFRRRMLRYNTNWPEIAYAFGRAHVPMAVVDGCQTPARILQRCEQLLDGLPAGCNGVTTQS